MPIQKLLVVATPCSIKTRVQMNIPLFILIGVMAVALTPHSRAQEIPPDRLNTVIEALLRLGPDSVGANPKLQEALKKVIAASRGTERFVELVGTFHLTNQSPALIELASSKPNNSAGVAAANLLLANKETESLAKNLATAKEAQAANLARALGNTGKGGIVQILLPLLSDDLKRPAVQKEALRALVNSKAGAEAIVALAKSDRIPDSLKLTAAMELNGVRWADIKKAAAELLPLPQGQGGKSLPPIAQLIQRKGDIANGMSVFNREIIACNRCHAINGLGTDFGPGLSEIGSKLTKEALYESILNPSGGISMGFEAWTIETKDNDEFFGIIVSDTDKEVALKQVGGLVTKIARTNIAHRQKSGLSSMPAGLQQLMTELEIVDLVEYLASLKKAN